MARMMISIVMSLLLVTQSAFGAASLPTPKKAGADFRTLSPCFAEPGARASRTGQAPGNERVQVLTGSQALAFVNQQLLTNANFAAAQARSRVELAQKGWRPTNNIVVARLLRERQQGLVDRLFGYVFPRLHAQTQYDADGWVTFTSWDDGVNNTWEGNTYGERYDGSWMSQDAQIQIDVEDRPVLWWGGGSGRVRDRVVSLPDRILGFVAPTVRAQTTGTDCDCNNPMSWRRCILRGAIRNSAGPCGGWLYACAFIGPWYWGCVGGTCIGSFTGEFLRGVYNVGQICG